MKDVCERNCGINNTIDTVYDSMNNMNISNNNMTSNGVADSILVCANCEKEGGSDNMNTCNKCNKVKYCNAACKKKHRHKHKKECEEYCRLAAERAAELHDEELFKQPPLEHGDCPICFLRMPTLGSTGYKYHACCGKQICSGCCYAPLYDDQGNEVDNQKCPFCRTPFPKSYEENIKRLQKRVKANDVHAMLKVGINHFHGLEGFPQDHAKGLEYWHRAAELGYAKSYCNVGVAYDHGEGVEVDEKKATYYYEQAAMGGCEKARYNLGVDESKAGNMERALKHHMIAVKGGFSNSLDCIKELYADGDVTKEVYTKALQSYQTYLGEIKSRQRDEAAAFDNEEYRYY